MRMRRNATVMMMVGTLATAGLIGRWASPPQPMPANTETRR